MLRTDRKRLNVQFTLEPPIGAWVIDWKRVETQADVMDILWQLTRGMAWVGDEPPSGISHLVKRVEE